MKQKILTTAFVAAIAIFAGTTVYNAQRPEAMSDIAFANVEALASDESFNGHTCEGTWNQECCVCGSRHYTYARPSSISGCEYRTNCSHY